MSIILFLTALPKAQCDCGTCLLEFANKLDERPFLTQETIRRHKVKYNKYVLQTSSCFVDVEHGVKAEGKLTHKIRNNKSINKKKLEIIKA